MTAALLSGATLPLWLYVATGESSKRLREFATGLSFTVCAVAILKSLGVP